jgi:hypothetical protein
VQHLKDFAFERALKDKDSVGAFGMPGARIVFEARRVAYEKRRH